MPTTEVLNIILSAVSIIVTGLATWGVKAFTSWIGTKIKDEKLAKYLTQITEITSDAVMNIYQSFVETLKANGKFDAEAQKQAKKAALNIIESQLTDELKGFIVDNYGDMRTWLENKIEAVIYTLKK